MELIFELLAEIFAEFILHTLIGNFITYTSALFLWLFYGLKPNFSYYLFREDENKASKAAIIGFVFYVSLFITWLVLHDC